MHHIQFTVIRADNTRSEAHFLVPDGSDLDVLAEHFKQHGELSSLGCKPVFDPEIRSASARVQITFDFRH